MKLEKRYMSPSINCLFIKLLPVLIIFDREKPLFIAHERSKLPVQELCSEAVFRLLLLPSAAAAAFFAHLGGNNNLKKKNPLNDQESPCSSSVPPSFRAWMAGDCDKRGHSSHPPFFPRWRRQRRGGKRRGSVSNLPRKKWKGRGEGGAKGVVALAALTIFVLLGEYEIRQLQEKCLLRIYFSLAGCYKIAHVGNLPTM